MDTNASVNKNRRCETRYLAHVPVKLISEGRPNYSVTEDVSNRGMRLRTDAHPPLRSLVRLHVDLPSGISLVMHAVVVHVGLDQDCAQPAVGLQFYGNSDEDSATWRAFVDEIRMHGRARRYSDRAAAVTTLYPQTHADLGSIQRAARAGRQLFVPTWLKVETGELIHLIVVHHANRRLFALTGVVVSSAGEDLRPGLLVQLPPFTVRQRADFNRFLSAATESAYGPVAGSPSARAAQ